MTGTPRLIASYLAPWLMCGPVWIVLVFGNYPTEDLLACTVVCTIIGSALALMSGGRA